MLGITAARGKTPAGISIGELSKRTSVNIETIRYYEKIKILRRPARTEGGRRIYSTQDVRTLAFVRRSRELGFTLEEIRTLLRLVEGGYTCGQVKDLTLHHLTDVKRKIADLRRIARTLSVTSRKCVGGTIPECPVIDALLAEHRWD
jgi:MerR family mercuric resistance operon transcriptional regulator